jgi:hypothetical protein
MNRGVLMLLDMASASKMRRSTFSSTLNEEFGKAAGPIRVRDAHPRGSLTHIPDIATAARVGREHRLAAEGPDFESSPPKQQSLAPSAHTANADRVRTF